MRQHFFLCLIRLLPLLAALWQPAAHADVWGYVDDKGDTHFASHQVDGRYQLYFKTESASAAAMGSPVGMHRTGRPAAHLAFNPVADAAAGLKAQRLVRLINQSKAFQLVRSTLQQEAARHGLSIHLVKAIAAAESGFNPRAVSSAGAVGLMQIMPDTARMLGLRADKDKTIEAKLTDPATNARLGARYLSQLLRQFGGRTDLAVAAYNAGPGAVRKRMAIPPYAETQNYVRTVLAIYETLQPDNAQSISTAAWASTSHADNRPVSGRRRRQMVIAGSRPAATKTDASPAHITLKAQAADNAAAPSALDEIAEKITTADSLLALDADVYIAPPAAP